MTRRVRLQPATTTQQFARHGSTLDRPLAAISSDDISTSAIADERMIETGFPGS
jgi:hypothetical protein